MAKPAWYSPMTSFLPPARASPGISSTTTSTLFLTTPFRMVSRPTKGTRAEGRTGKSSRGAGWSSIRVTPSEYPLTRRAARPRTLLIPLLKSVQHFVVRTSGRDRQGRRCRPRSLWNRSAIHRFGRPERLGWRVVVRDMYRSGRARRDELSGKMVRFPWILRNGREKS